MLKRIAFIVSLLTTFIGLAACGAAPASAPSGGVSSAPVPIELPALTGNLSGVPLMTDPVVSGSSLNVAKRVHKSSESGAYGLKLGYADSSDFPAGSAYMSCGEIRNLRNTLGNTATTDYLLCILRRTVTTDLNSDETYYATLSGTPTPRYTKVKFSITAAADSTVTDFELFGCSQYGQHTYYTTLTRNDTAITTRNLYITPDSGVNGPPISNVDATLTGTITSNNQYTEKSIHTRWYIDDHNGVLRYADATYTQPTATSYTHSSTGGSVLGDTAATGLSYAAGSLVDYNTSLDAADYDINLLGLSDGAARVVNYDADGNQTIDFAQGWAWDGSMMAPDTASSYLLTVNSATLQSRISSSDVDLGFASGQTWDCSIPSTADSDHTLDLTTDGFDVSQCDNLMALSDASLDCEELDLSFDN